MDTTRDQTEGPADRRMALVEIVAGYALILGVMAVMFFGASGIGLEIPWEVFAGVAAVGGVLAGAALRNRPSRTPSP